MLRSKSSRFVAPRDKSGCYTHRQKQLRKNTKIQSSGQKSDLFTQKKSKRLKKGFKPPKSIEISSTISKPQSPLSSQPSAQDPSKPQTVPILSQEAEISIPISDTLLDSELDQIYDQYKKDDQQARQSMEAEIQECLETLSAPKSPTVSSITPSELDQLFNSQPTSTLPATEDLLSLFTPEASQNPEPEDSKQPEPEKADSKEPDSEEQNLKNKIRTEDKDEKHSEICSQDLVEAIEIFEQEENLFDHEQILEIRASQEGKKELCGKKRRKVLRKLTNFL